MTRNEAARLGDELRDLSRLEARYRASNGLSQAERRDLDRRFESLSQRVRFERNDRQGRNDHWAPINQRQRNLNARIDAGVRSGQLSRAEALRLRTQYGRIAAL